MTRGEERVMPILSIIQLGFKEKRCGGGLDYWDHMCALPFPPQSTSALSTALTDHGWSDVPVKELVERAKLSSYEAGARRSQDCIKDNTKWVVKVLRRYQAFITVKRRLEGILASTLTSGA